MTSQITANAVRATVEIDGRRASYLDFGGNGRPLLALHGHLYEGVTWSELARELAPEWRVIAPDQRGHGDSDRASGYSREDYIADAIALLDHLGLEQVAVLGHSGGGITAYQLAARHPERVIAFIDEDGPASLPSGGPSALSFVLGFPYEAATREELVMSLGPVGPMFGDALRENPDGSWRLPFHPQDTVTSEEGTQGDHWADWKGSSCPALLLRGLQSQVLAADLAQTMVATRPSTRLVEIDADHFIHTAAPGAFAAAVRDFLRTV
jgi:pimeloyl-ACP methyl ester carboxylesterase